MDKYATIYSQRLKASGSSFDWDDSILVDSEARITQMMTLVNAGIISKSEFRQWYFNESESQANAALEAVHAEAAADVEDSFKIRNE
ncbi:hypothetical protein AAK899_03140 [Erysipelotrichaceae bacterium 51-3]